MSLHLDARQRAMLQEMGVTVWSPAEAPATAGAGAGETAAPAPAKAAAPTSDATPNAAPAAAMAAPAAVAARPAAARPPAVPAASAANGAVPVGAPSLRLHAPKALYPTADPAKTPSGLGAGWLIVTESLTPDEPLGGDAGRLLDNMLRAMQLHLHPRVFLLALERTAPGTQASADIPGAMSEAVASLKPALVLVLGHVAARAALGRAEPLGRLRAGPHQLADCPTVVTYDPAFLLRSQDTKAAAWADLCRALSIVRAAPPPVP